MVTDPRALPATASAQAAAALLVRPEVRTVLVVDGDRLLGIVSPADLVERVVAAGRDPRTTALADVVDGDVPTIQADAEVEEAIRLMEEYDCERLPVLEGDRLVGVLSRSGLTRRLAEDEPPTAPDDV